MLLNIAAYRSAVFAKNHIGNTYCWKDINHYWRFTAALTTNNKWVSERLKDRTRKTIVTLRYKKIRYFRIFQSSQSSYILLSKQIVIMTIWKWQLECLWKVGWISCLWKCSGGCYSVGSRDQTKVKIMWQLWNPTIT